MKRALVVLLLFAGCKSTAKDREKSEMNEAGEAKDQEEVLVAGASDLVFVMQELTPLFEKESGIKVKFTPGSSGKLAAQIKEGAPFDVFFSANVAFVDDVIAAGACQADSKALYARGRLVMWAGPNSDPPLPAELAGLTDQRYARIAIANPEHAPYGAAAKQAMEKVGVWEALKPRIVYGSNIKETMQFVETGNADVAIIALALAVKAEGKHIVIPEELHRPIDQGMVVCSRGKSSAAGRKFAAFVARKETVAIMERFGFAVPATSKTSN
jgi:molybdate transport system substrate-binding protein